MSSELLYNRTSEASDRISCINKYLSEQLQESLSVGTFQNLTLCKQYTTYKEALLSSDQNNYYKLSPFTLFIYAHGF